MSNLLPVNGGGREGKRNGEPVEQQQRVIKRQYVSPGVVRSSPMVNVGNSNGVESGMGSMKLTSNSTGHRPVTSCSHCRQHKIKCNASDKFPDPCTRCERNDLSCEIDPQFRPKKGSQLQLLKNEVDDLKSKIETLIQNDNLILSSLEKLSNNSSQASPGTTGHSVTSNTFESKKNASIIDGTGNKTVTETHLTRSPSLIENIGATLNGANEYYDPLHRFKKRSLQDNKKLHTEFVLRDVTITLEKANALHDTFIKRYLPYFPIMESYSASELFEQSQLLFWTVMLTACLSDPEPMLYTKLADLIKQLAIETCWMRTPRSTHISQALLILCIWPLPNQKVLDDCSYRFVGLAKSLSLQLGLHRGEFISEFTRSQATLPNAEKWRTRTWIGVYFSELCWAGILGLPPTSQTDYLIEKALTNNFSSNNNENDKTTMAEKLGVDLNDKDKEIFLLPSTFHKLLCLAHFQNNLYNVMGSSIVRSDGLIDPKNRASALVMIENELNELDKNISFEEDVSVNIYYLYVKLTVCCFAFFSEPSDVDQEQYVTKAYICATKIITLLTKLLETRQLIELPIYVRHSVMYAALMLFKLQVTPYLTEKYIDSARQSIVTVHRLYRNQLTAWATKVENDISRTASVLEKLNFVLITHPEVYTEEEGILPRMRSHLTGSLFYDLISCVHEARKREVDPEYYKKVTEKNFLKQEQRSSLWKPLKKRKMHPLPFYNQISKENFTTISKTTPNGTTMTKLVPTEIALEQAKELASNNKNFDGTVSEINGIPVAMLNETGSVKVTSNNESPSNPTNVPHIIAFTRSNLALNLEVNMPQTTTNAAYNLAELNRSLKSTTSLNDSSSMQRSYSIPAQWVSSTQTNQQSMPTFTAENMLYTPTTPSVQQQNIASNSNLDIAATLQQNSNQLLQYLERQPQAPPQAPAPPLQRTASQMFDASHKQEQQHKNQQSVLSELDNFLLQQSNGWIESNHSNDDFLGWFDINMKPGF